MIVPCRHIPERSLARFWAKVVKTEGCWNWIGAKNLHGYGKLNILGRHWAAHRYAFVLAGNVLPDDQFLCHRCDNPACVRPDHMFVGTQTDNMRDASAKGRVAHGEGHPYAKLTVRAVTIMRQRYALGGITFKELGALFGISAQTAHAAVRVRWRHVDPIGSMP